MMQQASTSASIPINRYDAYRYNSKVSMFRSNLSRLTSALLTLVVCSCAGNATKGTPTVTATVSLPTARPTIALRATPTLAPAMLPIPKEPSATPTPVKYKVQEGDTPISIANKFGVSVADLIALNNIDPATLQIGAVLTIPTGPQSSQEGNTLLPSPTPIPLTVRGVNVYRTPVGSLECLGEVYNPGPATLGNVQLQVTLLNQADQVLIAVPFYVPQEVIPPGQSAPFRLLFTDPPAAYAKYSISTLRGESVDPTARFAQMKVTKVSAEPSGQQYRVYGEAMNVDTANATDVQLIITTYDSSKRVVGYRDLVIDQGTLAPNAVQPFDTTIASASTNVTSYSVVVLALKAQ